MTPLDPFRLESAASGCHPTSWSPISIRTHGCVRGMRRLQYSGTRNGTGGTPNQPTDVSGDQSQHGRSFPQAMSPHVGGFRSHWLGSVCAVGSSFNQNDGSTRQPGLVWFIHQAGKSAFDERQIRWGYSGLSPIDARRHRLTGVHSTSG